MMPVMMGQFKVDRLPSKLVYRFPDGKEIWSASRIDIIEWAYCLFGTNYQPKVVKEMK